MSIASIASQASSTSTTAGSANSQVAAASLSGNLQDFLKMLMTQLQNQDPTSPMDTQSFTTELVQFASVEQQINTNSSLTQLISLTQSDGLLQASSLVGKTAQLTASQMPLQNGTGSLTITATTPGTAQIAISTTAGVSVLNASISTTAGSNTWTWNGKDSQGNTVADGSYKVTVTGTDSTGATSALPFTVSGTITGVQKTSTALDVLLGTQSDDITTLQSLQN